MLGQAPRRVRLFLVRSYRSAGEMWREWGRSLDLRQTTSAVRQWLDVAFLVAVQALPLPVLILLGVAARTSTLGPASRPLAAVNALLLGIRLLLLVPLSRSYEKPGPSFWLSWVADPLAVLRIVLSTLQRRRQWRGRRYVRRP